MMTGRKSVPRGGDPEVAALGVEGAEGSGWSPGCRERGGAHASVGTGHRAPSKHSLRLQTFSRGCESSLKDLYSVKSCYFVTVAHPVCVEHDR